MNTNHHWALYRTLRSSLPLYHHLYRKGKNVEGQEPILGLLYSPICYTAWVKHYNHYIGVYTTITTTTQPSHSWFLLHHTELTIITILVVAPPITAASHTIIPEIIPVLTNTAISGLAFVLIGWFRATHFTSLRCYFHLY